MFAVHLFIVFCLLLKGFFAEQSFCERIASETARADRNTVVIRTTNRLIGTWISQGCETRPGPEYLLRIYIFTEDGNYHGVQHHYWDESCTSPRYTVSAFGRLRLGVDAYSSAGATTVEYRQLQVNITPHDTRSATDFSNLVDSECSGFVRKIWRAHEDHIVLDATNNGYRPWNNNRRLQRRYVSKNYNSYYVQRNPMFDSASEIQCLGGLKWTFNELKLTKVQLRPEFRPALNFNHGDASKMNFELLLGDIHSRQEYQESYNPTSFQPALIRYTKEPDNFLVAKRKYNLTSCQLCSLITERSIKSPPHLIKKPNLPPFILGEWTSIRCEVRPLGLYLTRRFRFYSGDLTWIGEHKFYVDPFCIVPKFTVTAAGHFKSSGPSTILKGSSNFDFQIERASLTIFKQAMLDEMKNNRNCGSGPWEKGIPRELSSTNGCLQLGILIPSIQYEIVRTDIDFHGSTLLFMGQADTDNQPRTKFQRPTAFQDPLVHCSNLPMYSENLREILNTPIYIGQGYYTTFDYLQSNSNINILHINCIFFYSILLFIFS